MKTIAIFSSGTGGHVYPANTLAQDYLAKKFHVIWIGTKEGIENKIVNQKEIDLFHVKSKGFRGKQIIEKIQSLLYLLVSFVQVFSLMRKNKPCLVIGFGGYISLPGIITAFLLRIPRVIHEQNAIAGTANRICYYFANKVFETFPGSFKKFNTKIIHSGSIVRSELSNCSKPEDIYNSNSFFLKILVLGGSQGSVYFNSILPFALSHFSRDRFEVKHICGEGKLADTKKKYHDYGIKSSVIEYSNQMSDLFDWSTLVICRSGSTTLSELSIIGRACILIPYPYATDNHQYKNAEYLSNNSAAITLSQDDNFIENFVTTINLLLNNESRLHALAQNIMTVLPYNGKDIIIKSNSQYLSDK